LAAVATGSAQDAAIAAAATGATAAQAPARLRSAAWFYTYLPNRVGMGSTMSLMAIYVTEILGGSLSQLGVVTALTSGASVPAAAFWGWLSDRVGSRKLYLILGFLGFAIPTLLMGLSTTVAQFLWLSILVGALSVAGSPVSSTLIMDTTPKEQWDEAFGRFNQICGWGMVAGRMLGLVCIAYGIAAFGNEPTQRGLWILGGSLGLLSVGWAWWAVPALGMPKPRPRAPLPEAVRHTGFPLLERVRYLPHLLYYLPQWNLAAAVRQAVHGAQERLGDLPHVVRRGTRRGWKLVHEPLIAYLVATFFQFTMSNMGYTPFAVWQRQDLGNSSGDVFLVGLMNSLAAAPCYRWAGQWTRRFGSLRVQTVTLALRVGVFGGFAVMSWLGLRGPVTILLLILLQLLSGLSWAGIAVAGNSTVARLAPQGNEGAAMGTYTSTMSIGAILGALVSGYLVEWLGYGPVFAVGATGIGLAALALWAIRRSVPNPEEHNL
jgi:MFS family permease